MPVACRLRLDADQQTLFCHSVVHAKTVFAYLHGRFKGQVRQGQLYRVTKPTDPLPDQPFRTLAIGPRGGMTKP